MSKYPTLTKNEAKLIRSLKHIKYRDKEGLFVAETEKVIKDLLPHFTLEILLIDSNNHLNTSLLDIVPKSKCRLTDSKTFNSCSNLTNGHKYLAVFKKPDPKSIKDFLSSDFELVIALDRVQNPGNIGTIIRSCEWFGVGSLILSKGCADIFQPKVIQSTMGAIGGLDIYQGIDLENWIDKLSLKYNIVTTDIKGKSIYEFKKTDKPLLLILGNEGQGVADELVRHASTTLTIPRSEKSNLTESLNVAVSTAVILSHLTKY